MLNTSDWAYDRIYLGFYSAAKSWKKQAGSEVDRFGRLTRTSKKDEIE